MVSFFKSNAFTIFIMKQDSPLSQKDLVSVRVSSRCPSAGTPRIAPHFPQRKGHRPSSALPGSAWSVPWQVTGVLYRSLACSGCSWTKPGIFPPPRTRAFALALPSARSSPASDCARRAHLLQMFAPLRQSEHSVGRSV